MEKIVVINGSHRAPLSNSRRFGKYLMKYMKTPSEEFLLNRNNHDEILKETFAAEKVVLLFPLYFDSPPSMLLTFLGRMEKMGQKYKGRPTVYVVINCGFAEHHHMEAAQRIIAYFLKKNGFPYGGAFMIGSGEAILDTPFRMLVTSKMKAFARAIDGGKPLNLSTQMPVPTILFVKIVNNFWALKGSAHGTTKESMKSMDIY